MRVALDSMFFVLYSLCCVFPLPCFSFTVCLRALSHFSQSVQSVTYLLTDYTAGFC